MILTRSTRRISAVQLLKTIKYPLIVLCYLCFAKPEEVFRSFDHNVAMSSDRGIMTRFEVHCAQCEDYFIGESIFTSALPLLGCSTDFLGDPIYCAIDDERTLVMI